MEIQASHLTNYVNVSVHKCNVLIIFSLTTNHKKFYYITIIGIKVKLNVKLTAHKYTVLFIFNLTLISIISINNRKTHKFWIE